MLKTPGGWDPLTGTLKPSLVEEIDQAFANVDLALRDAGGAGWAQVYLVRLYVLDEYFNDEEALGRIVENLKRWSPGRQPLLTAVGVARLGAGSSEGMKVEVEVEAYVGE